MAEASRAQPTGRTGKTRFIQRSTRTPKPSQATALCPIGQDQRAGSVGWTVAQASAWIKRCAGCGCTEWTLRAHCCSLHCPRSSAIPCRTRPNANRPQQRCHRQRPTATLRARRADCKLGLDRRGLQHRVYQRDREVWERHCWRREEHAPCVCSIHLWRRVKGHVR